MDITNSQKKRKHWLLRGCWPHMGLMLAGPRAVACIWQVPVTCEEVWIGCREILPLRGWQPINCWWVPSRLWAKHYFQLYPCPQDLDKVEKYGRALEPSALFPARSPCPLSSYHYAASVSTSCCSALISRSLLMHSAPACSSKFRSICMGWGPCSVDMFWGWSAGWGWICLGVLGKELIVGSNKEKYCCATMSGHCLLLTHLCSSKVGRYDYGASPVH